MSFVSICRLPTAALNQTVNGFQNNAQNQIVLTHLRHYTHSLLAIIRFNPHHSAFNFTMDYGGNERGAHRRAEVQQGNEPQLSSR